MTRIDWENPHVHYFVDVTQPDGTVVNWACETGGPNRLAKRGWTARFAEAGRQGNRARVPCQRRLALRRRTEGHARRWADYRGGAEAISSNFVTRTSGTSIAFSARRLSRSRRERSNGMRTGEPSVAGRAERTALAKADTLSRNVSAGPIRSGPHSDDEIAETGEFRRNRRRARQDAEKLHHNRKAGAFVATPRCKCASQRSGGIASGQAIAIESDMSRQLVAQDGARASLPRG